jgi:hypothetical protein
MGSLLASTLLVHSNNLDRCGEVRSRSVAIAVLRAEAFDLPDTSGISSEGNLPISDLDFISALRCLYTPFPMS